MIPGMPRLDRFGFRIVREVAVAPAAPHLHGELEAAWVETAGWSMVFGRRRRELPPRRLVLHFAGVPHHLERAPAGGEATWITIPVDVAATGAVPPRLLRRCLGGAVIVDPEPQPDDAQSIGRLVADWRRGGDWRAWTQEWMRVRLRRLDLALAGRGGALDGDPGFIGRAIPALIAAAPVASTGVQHLARELGYHPKYFIQRFRRLTGIGARDLLARVRVARAMELLRTRPELGLDAVADAAGFGSLSALYRAFRAVTGRGARAWRRRA